MAIPAGLACGLYGFILSHYSLLIALPVLLVGSAAIGLLDRVTVVRNRSPRYCAACRYDLTGTLAAGITRCPECGFEAAQTWLGQLHKPAAAADRGRGTVTVIRMVVGATAASERQSVFPRKLLAGTSKAIP